jgi:hypothetical protein
MFSSEKNPKWWQLYLSFPVLIALFVIDHRLKISAPEHEAMQVGIIVLIYGFIHLWLKANAGALSGMDRRQVHGRIRVIHIPSHPLPDHHSQFQLPDVEVKGVLGDTFELDIIDAKLLPIEDAADELDKE